MGLPPIISNSPLFKLFKPSSAATKNLDKALNKPAEQPQDVVEISQTAQKRLDGVRALHENEVLAALKQARGALENHDVSLGLDPKSLK